MDAGRVEAPKQLDCCTCSMKHRRMVCCMWPRSAPAFALVNQALDRNPLYVWDSADRAPAAVSIV